MGAIGIIVLFYIVLPFIMTGVTALLCFFTKPKSKFFGFALILSIILFLVTLSWLAKDNLGYKTEIFQSPHLTNVIICLIILPTIQSYIPFYSVYHPLNYVNS